ncbi:dephospho-CoA kinase [Candidatus Kaistella beijingensis]|jgi:shikimate kinase|uniref:shikimate kinase n=1 Tax=Candidatus Kaistella beijingensis TaxID=2820270 RepID=UPI001CC57350|nr:shikimate kinase [Candidatus Kaistella beijingensis]UBB90572.1 dephospho-CoA kinase [Candidatus Kaistella beijingensis]HQD44515.1 dephospho-CoA kinase [Kaistella sp.]
MIISLIGYMGSGKSHIAKLLSDRLGIKLIDLDKEISKKNKMTIAEMFQKKGEIFFRRQERALLEEIVATEDSCILSLGGGTPAYYNNMELINQNSESIFLRTSVKNLTERLLKQKHKRPLIANISDQDLPEFIAKHLFERNIFYNKAKYTVNTDDKTPEMVVEELCDLL